MEGPLCRSATSPPQSGGELESGLREDSLGDDKNALVAAGGGEEADLFDGAEVGQAGERCSLRAKVEHPFLYLKQRFGYRRARYRGLAKNHQRLALLLGLANLLIAEPRLA